MAWLSQRWMAFTIVVVLLVISVESRAASPPEPAPDAPTTAPELEPEPPPLPLPPQVEATPEDLPPPDGRPGWSPPNHARGLGRMIAGTAILSFSAPALVTSTILLADMPNEATAGIWGITTVVAVSGAALLGTGAQSFVRSPRGDSRREKTGVGMIISGTAVTSLGASSMIIMGGLGGWGSWSDPLFGTLLGVGSLSAASGVALVIAGAVRRKHRPCLACTRLSPLVSFGPRGGHAGIVLRF